MIHPNLLLCFVSVQKIFTVPSTAEQMKIPFARVNHAKYMVTDRVVYIGTLLPLTTFSLTSSEVEYKYIYSFRYSFEIHRGVFIICYLILLFFFFFTTYNWLHLERKNLHFINLFWAGIESLKLYFLLLYTASEVDVLSPEFSTNLFYSNFLNKLILYRFT